MDLSYGARLRLQREHKGVALRAIAEQTKIKLSLLERLERDDVSQWPGGIFRRSYFRAYAQAIGLDPDTSVREFLQRHPDPVEELASGIDDERSTGGETGRRPATRLRYLIDSAVGAIPALRHSPPHRHGLRGGTPPVAGSSSPGLHEPLADEHLRPAATQADPTAGDDSELEEPGSLGVDFSAVAELCTRLGRALDARDVAQVLAGAVTVLDAIGVILWIWDPRERALGAVLAHGYSDEIVHQLPRVPEAADNAIAAAFRSAEPRVVDGSESATGAVVVPLLTPAGCAGVLAVELRRGAEQHEGARAATTILAAQMATLVGSSALAHAVSA